MGEDVEEALSFPDWRADIPRGWDEERGKGKAGGVGVGVRRPEV